MEIISATVARSNFSEIINKVKYGKKIIAIERNNKTEVYIIPALEEYPLDVTAINSQSTSFSFLEDEPELYSIHDLKKKYV